MPTIVSAGLDSNYNPQYLITGTEECTLTATALKEYVENQKAISNTVTLTLGEVVEKPIEE